MKLSKPQFICVYCLFLVILLGPLRSLLEHKISVADTLAFMAKHQLDPQECYALAGFSWVHGHVYEAGEQVSGLRAAQLLKVRRQGVFCFGRLPTGKKLADILPSGATIDSKGCFSLSRFKVCQKTSQSRVSVLPD